MQKTFNLQSRDYVQYGWIPTRDIYVYNAPQCLCEREKIEAGAVTGLKLGVGKILGTSERKNCAQCVFLAPFLSNFAPPP